MKILSSHYVCDLRIDETLTRFGTIEWFLVDQGQEGYPTIAQGTREEIAARVREEMSKG